MNQTLKKRTLLASLLIAGTLAAAGMGLSAAENGSGSPDKDVERTRQIVKMLDDLCKHDSAD